jgi:hypothetical protein
LCAVVREESGGESVLDVLYAVAALLIRVRHGLTVASTCHHTRPERTTLRTRPTLGADLALSHLIGH